jgi:hypothetical protein
MQVITQKNLTAVYCHKILGPCVCRGPHITRSTYLSRYRTALALRLAQFDVALQSQVHHVREFECLRTNITVITITSITIPELQLLTLCRSYLNPYCLGRKTAFFSVGIQIYMLNQKQESLTVKKIITIKLKETE